MDATEAQTQIGKLVRWPADSGKGWHKGTLVSVHKHKARIRLTQDAAIGAKSGTVEVRVHRLRPFRPAGDTAANATSAAFAVHEVAGQVLNGAGIRNPEPLPTAGATLEEFGYTEDAEANRALRTALRISAGKVGPTAITPQVGSRTEEELLALPVRRLRIKGTRYIDALERDGIRTVGDLYYAQRHGRRLVTIPGIGREGMQAVDEAMDAWTLRGLCLPEPEGFAPLPDNLRLPSPPAEAPPAAATGDVGPYVLTIRSDVVLYVWTGPRDRWVIPSADNLDRWHTYDTVANAGRGRGQLVSAAGMPVPIEVVTADALMEAVAEAERKAPPRKPAPAPAPAEAPDAAIHRAVARLQAATRARRAAADAAAAARREEAAARDAAGKADKRQADAEAELADARDARITAHTRRQSAADALKRAEAAESAAIAESEAAMQAVATASS
jgi:hypothetical protein